MDNGVQYELTFSLASKLVSKAMVSATGCQGVTMNEKTYWAMEPKGNGFRALLEQVIGLNDDEFVVVTLPPTQTTSSSSADSNSIVYTNTQYGFQFSLPESWKGYSIVNSKWEGSTMDEKSASEKVVETGPLISIRDSQWTAQTPRQDIPIMVFTLSQWNSLQRGAFHIGAAPIGPSELGRNDKYVFALPTRYNYSFPPGYEEVDKILKSNPLKAFN
jgi:hypothetical protein